MRPLLHIGYHKTGAIWLQRCVFPNTKAGLAFVAGVYKLQPAFIKVDPFGFDPEAARQEFDPLLEEAQDSSLVPVLSHERLSGSPYAGGHDSGLIADRLAATFPETRVLVVIREQRSVISSVYKQYVRTGGAASLRQYFNSPAGTGRMPAFRFEFYEYHHLIGYYQRLFGVENLLVLSYELLKEHPAAFLERLGKFLGVPADATQFGQVNISVSALSTMLKRHANRYVVRDALNPAPPFEIEGSNKALRQACWEVDKRVPKPILKEYERRWRRDLESRIGYRYTRSNAQTEKLTNLDLRGFGYPCGDPA